MEKYTAISLFSSSGIGDIALQKNKIDVLVANELLEDRCSIYKRNFPKTHIVSGDIEQNHDEIIHQTKKRLGVSELDFALVTPPCQGMSKNGRGKLLAEIKAGRRPKIDPRNLLIIPALSILRSLNPKTIIFENVVEMKNTLIPREGAPKLILEVIRDALIDYTIEVQSVELANYGVPQNRQRLITIATRDNKLIKYFNKFGTLFPVTTHAKQSPDKKKWVTVRDIIGKLEPLDGKTKFQSKKDPLHRVPKLDDKKYRWIKCTPLNKSAFDNQCDKCGFDENLTHMSSVNSEGINRPSSATPIYCQQCGELLPRPVTKKNGTIKLMKGFTSAYKRMDWDSPASAVTRNFPYACSDKKIHPNQHRVLSIREACLLHTIDANDFIFENEYNKPATFTSIRDTLGESIPPKFLHTIINHFIRINKEETIYQDIFAQQSIL